MRSLDDFPELLQVPSGEDDPAASHERSEDLRRLYACLDGLEPEKKEIVLLVYYHGKVVFEDPTAPSSNSWLWLAIVLVALAIGFVLYNAIMKALPNKVLGAAINLAIFVGVYYFLECVGHFSGRALYVELITEP